MKFTFDIPDDLLPAVARIFEEQRMRDDDDGMTDCIIMEEMKLSVPQYVKATNIVSKMKQELSSVADVFKKTKLK